MQNLSKLIRKLMNYGHRAMRAIVKRNKDR
jgi:hypothetical protein